MGIMGHENFEFTMYAFALNNDKMQWLTFVSDYMGGHKLVRGSNTQQINEQLIFFLRFHYV